ncbi:uncharacterized protein PpBr36_10081 [Pyricularia pennisetigena]|uniref:uncharacterized protein n=1 Tax=Pyricularia pennisetigena TaxID=1578925 RepID=UPI00114FAF85|nr:uncharacterized protein PpBr36_10081 [Pyricularia pennisetigena]TLS22386.1 hypothetical protein PpBr36_10081 [Pyricularia pennisetigena]
MRPRSLAVALAATSPLAAQACTTQGSTPSAGIHQGFNYGSRNSTGGCRDRGEFTRLFNLARSLPAASPDGAFSSARLYTTIECGTEGSPDPRPISAFQAAVDTNTTLLLGLWASSGQVGFTRELNTLVAALADPAYGSQLAGLVVGLAVGSEDMFRADAIARGTCGADVSRCAAGATAAEIAAYVQQTRAALQGTALAGVAIGHVDTPGAWVLDGAAALVQQLDWVGHNSFPYWEEGGQENGIDNAGGRFDGALGVTIAAAGRLPVWVTETGWPSSGPNSGNAEASPANAMKYWRDVGRQRLFGQRCTWWYILEDSNPDQSALSFAVWDSSAGQTRFSLDG